MARAPCVALLSHIRGWTSLHTCATGTLSCSHAVASFSIREQERSMSRRAFLGICAIVLLLAGAGLGAGVTAFAVTSDPSVHACVANNTGAARIVSASASCYSNEHILTWSVTGPIGPIGATGAAGAPGATGPQGATGSTGATWSQGVAGTSDVYVTGTGGI